MTQTFRLTAPQVKTAVFLAPLTLVCVFFLYQSYSYPLHDFSNSYFPARLAVENKAPETIVFDIYKFNTYAWDHGYPEVLIDFYLNSPFTATAFYPFGIIDNAYLAKLMFNGMSILLFLIATYLLARKFLDQEKQTLLLVLPIILYVPLKNEILFGQSYLLVFFLVSVAFLMIDKNKLMGSVLLSLAALIKIFPVFYGISLLYSKKWKAISYAFAGTVILLLISIIIAGSSFWHTYFTQVLPNAITNESTMDFHFSAQSITVFLKNVFVRDQYYNPESLFNSYLTYKILSLLVKVLIIGAALQLCWMYKNQLFELLSIWIVALFMLQTRTATYAQVLWIIPLFSMMNSHASTKIKLLFTLILVVVCNFPFHWLHEAHVILKFSRMWLTIALSVLFYLSMTSMFKFKFVIPPVVILLLVNGQTLFIKQEKFNSSNYVLEKHDNFMIYDFEEKNGFLTYRQLGINGDETIETKMAIHSFDTTQCSISDNQIVYKNRKITNNHALKKKPVLVNDSTVLYLTDHHGRRGAYTLKKINLQGR